MSHSQLLEPEEEEITKVEARPQQDPVGYLIGEVAGFRAGLSELKETVEALTKAVTASADTTLLAVEELRHAKPLLEEHSARLDSIEARCRRHHSNGSA